MPAPERPDREHPAQEGDFAEGEEKRAPVEHKGDFAEGQEKKHPDHRREATFAEGQEDLPEEEDEHEGDFAEGQKEDDD